MNKSTADVYIVNALSCGRDHTLALLANGKVIGWGGNGSGRVAPDTPGYCSTFKAPSRAVEVNLLQPLIAVAAGYGVSLGITARTEIAVWGANVAGIGGRHVNPRWVVRINDKPIEPYWADTIALPSGTPKIPGSVTFRSRFVDFKGAYVMHCHMRAHEDMGMMQTVEVA